MISALLMWAIVAIVAILVGAVITLVLDRYSGLDADISRIAKLIIWIIIIAIILFYGLRLAGINL